MKGSSLVSLGTNHDFVVAHHWPPRDFTASFEEKGQFRSVRVEAERERRVDTEARMGGREWGGGRHANDQRKSAGSSKAQEDGREN